MLNPEKLRQKTKEAAERLALERQREEERLRKQAEAQRLEAERRRLEDERQQHLNKLATQTWAAILKQAIQTAAHGGRSIQMNVPCDLVSVLQAEVQRLGLDSSMSLKTTFTSTWGQTLQRRLNVQSEKIRGSPHAGNFMGRLALGQLPSTNTALENLRLSVCDLLTEMMGDLETKKDSVSGLHFFLPDEARTYINLNLKPHLAADVTGLPIAQLEVSWIPKDVLKGNMSELHDMPSWLLSNRISQCMGLDADQGKNESVFTLHPLPINVDRWGQNAMMKFVHRIQPIGVCPFAPEVFAQAMSQIGFEAAVGAAPTGPTLNVRW